MEIKLRFLGATQNVTGSRYLLEANGTKLLIDCGLYQERHFRERNWEPFTIPPSSIDAVLLTHAHLDHCGLLPKLVREGFRGKIYCTEATAEIAQIVILDSAKIQMEDVEFKRKRHKREEREGPYPIIPLYTIEDAQACFPLFQTLKYNQEITIADGIKTTFCDTGHILGASAIRVEIANQKQKRTILFSGDVGRWNKPILRDPTIFTDADYVLCESTYGDRLHEKSDDIKEKLCEIIQSTQKAGGNIIIPSFAVERSQEVLYYLNELLLEACVPHLITFVDSPMAVHVTEVFNKHPELYDEEMLQRMNDKNSPFSFPGLTMVKSTSQSKAINFIRGTAVIIAGSGMCTGGRIKHHLVNNISRPECTILFVGYQAVGTLGREIVAGAEEVRILGQRYPVKARIVNIGGFSAHADQEELVQWLSGLKKSPKHLFVTHGEPETAKYFSSYLKEKFAWQTSVPEYQEEVVLD
jgi:metallo-beta-lactamase family protein